ncbi:PyrD [Parasponia andersonii]|uniref:PyrD n=1 Tax=Parasponia andersonii TaxID=3476 RepID=A0A2P5BAS8_PARAD|nr:PyrD [Parasponia andersonii]
MSLACLACHSVESPSHSFRSYSVSSSDNDGRCSGIAHCLTRRSPLPTFATSSTLSTSKVTPQPSIPNSSVVAGTPRLVRSCAVRRDLVRDWNFDEVVMER